MTEESIRNALSELRLPKEVISSLLQQTDRSRRELMRLVAEEIKRYLRAMDVPGEIRSALSGLTLEIDAKIRFVDSEDRVVVETEVKPRGKKRKRAKEPSSSSGVPEAKPAEKTESKE